MGSDLWGVAMTQFDRRSFLAGGLALGAGAATLGALGEPAGASGTNGPGRNGISTAKPVTGGSLTFGIDTEEGGFDPTTARWDEGGFLYGRTVFDPIAIVNTSGGVEPYLAQSITSNADFTSFTITLRPGIVFHDGTPLDANALYLNLEKQVTSILHRTGLRQFQKRFGDRAAGGHHHHEVLVGPVPLLPGPGPDGLYGGAVHAEQLQRDVAPRRHRALRLPRLGAQHPHDRHEEPPLTIIRSACRGLGRNTSEPKRAISKRDVDEAIISMAQHAKPKVIGQIADLRAQLKT